MHGRVRTVWVQREKVGNGWGEGPVGRSERACVDVCGRCGCKGKRLEMGGEKDRWAGASAHARTCADGWVQGKRLDMGGEKDRWAGGSVDVRTCADGRGANEKVGNGLREGRVRTVWMQG